jgi:AmmeMemoRadiSam system protein A
MFSTSEKKVLLTIARSAIEAVVLEKEFSFPSGMPKSLTTKCGAFVSLHKHGDLRGCIGYIEGIEPLAETVRDAAQKAAMEDYRFTPVTAEEIHELDIEISVLSPLELIQDVKEIEVGKHGILLDYQHARGLLLPQVAVEYNWDRETFLSQTARKAGLSADRWKSPGAKIFIFTAEIFSEHSLQ